MLKRLNPKAEFRNQKEIRSPKSEGYLLSNGIFSSGLIFHPAMARHGGSAPGTGAILNETRRIRRPALRRTAGAVRRESFATFFNHHCLSFEGMELRTLIIVQRVSS